MSLELLDNPRFYGYRVRRQIEGKTYQEYFSLKENSKRLRGAKRTAQQLLRHWWCLSRSARLRPARGRRRGKAGLSALQGQLLRALAACRRVAGRAKVPNVERLSSAPNPTKAP